MNGRRVFLGAAGATALAFAVAGMGAIFPAAALVDVFGNDYLLVTAIAGVGLLVAIPVLVSGRESNLQQTETPDPEEPVSVPPAGERFDRTVSSWEFRTPVVGRNERRTVRRRLRTAAVETVMRADDCDRSEARQKVDDGSWTDDAAVAAYLGDDVPSAGVGTRVGALVTGETWHERCARRAAEEIANRGRVDR